MEKLTLFIPLLLILALVLSMFKRGKYALIAKISRWAITLAGMVYYSLGFVNINSSGLVRDAVAIQIINKLPQPVDFYISKVRKNPTNEDEKYQLIHCGKIRTEHYRIEQLNMRNSDEYWIVGYIGKKNIVYFSQHSVPNKNIDQIVETNNYFIQSQKLSAIASKLVEAKKLKDIDRSIWVVLGLLLCLLNIILLIKNKRKNH